MRFDGAQIGGGVSGIGKTDFVAPKPDDENKKIATNPLVDAIGKFLNGSMGVENTHGGASAYTAQGTSNGTIA